MRLCSLFVQIKVSNGKFFDERDNSWEQCFYLDYNETSMDPINVPDEEMVETIVIEDDKTPKKVEDHTAMDDDIEDVTEDMTWIDEMQEFTEDDAAKLAAIEVVVEDEKEDGTEENTLEEAAIDSKENLKCQKLLP